jgi:dCTP deaminase
VVLSDATIARCLADGRIEIDPYDDALLQPSSVDVRVDNLFRVFHNNRYPFIDVKVEQEELTELVTVDGDHPFVLHPGEFVLGSTLERIKLPDDLVARLEGKSSWGGSGCSSTRPPASSTRAGTVTSRSSSRTSRTCRSRSTPA